MNKKYIITIKSEYEDSFKGLMILGAKDSNLFVDTLAVEDLEELNSDYINDHFGGLQEDAYKMGIAIGCADGRDELRQAIISITEMDNDTREKRFGYAEVIDILVHHSASKIIKKMKDNDKIEVGDEVYWSGDCFIVTRIFQPRNQAEQCDGIDDDGCVYSNVLIDDLEKTGRHFDIASILEEMRG